MADIKINLGSLVTPPDKPVENSGSGSGSVTTAKPATKATAAAADLASTTGAIPALSPAPAPKAMNATAAPLPPGDKPGGSASFQNIFSQKAAETKTPKMLESIVADKSAAEKLKPILGAAPTLQKSLQQEKEYVMKKKLRLVKVVLLLFVLAAVGMAVYFYSELSPSFNFFGPNTTTKLNDTNKNLRSLQTQLNKHRYLAAQLDLNRFSYVSDQFLDKVAQLNDSTVSAAIKAALTTEVTQAQTELPNILQRLRENLATEIVVQTTRSEAEPDLTAEQIQQQFEEDLRTALREERTAIAAASAKQNLEDLKLYDNTLKLVGNKALLQTVKNASPDNFKNQLEDYKTTKDQNNRKALQTLIASILATTKSDLSTISRLKNARIEWSTAIKQIELVTTERDKNFGKGLFETLGGILYTGYEFDANADKIVLSGMTRTRDASNFALISLLLDDLEGSEYFRDVQMRSFSKSGTTQEGFTANFKIDLKLEADGSSPKNTAVSLGKKPLAEKAGVKRIINLSKP